MTMVKVIRLITGEELMGKFVDETESAFEVGGLVTIHHTQSQNNPESTTIFLSPFAHLSKDKKLNLNKSHVLCTYEPIVELLNKYNSIFGSGIILPKTIS